AALDLPAERTRRDPGFGALNGGEARAHVVLNCDLHHLCLQLAAGVRLAGLLKLELGVRCHITCELAESRLDALSFERHQLSGLLRFHGFPFLRLAQPAQDVQRREDACRARSRSRPSRTRSRPNSNSTSS